MKNLLITVFFLSLTLQLSAETGGSNPVIVEKTTASLAEKTPVYWQKMAISEADEKPETSKSKPANTMATMAEIEGVCTDIPLKTSANWHK